MKRYLSWLVVMIGLAAVLLGVPRVGAADAVVGHGTAASCTEAAFDSALTAAQAAQVSMLAPTPAAAALSTAPLSAPVTQKRK